MRIRNLMTTGLVCMALAGFGTVSCSDDNDNGDNGGSGSVENVNPDKVFPAGVPAVVFGNSVTKDALGRVTSIGDIASFDYAPAEVRSSESDMTMTYYDGERYTIYINLNEKGFVRHAEAYCDHEPYMEWDINYDKQNQVSYVRMYEYEEDSLEEISFKYSNGGLDKYTGKGKVSGRSVTGSCEVSYTDDDYPEGIANKDRYIMWYDGIGGFDFDVLQIAYYAGLLGVGPEKLPLKLVQEQKAGKETYRGVEAYSWRLDSNGYPASVTTEYKDYYNGSLEESGSDSTHFSW